MVILSCAPGSSDELMPDVIGLDHIYIAVRDMARSEPFYDGHRLPDGVDIFYASADAGSEEFLPNQLMRTCDSLSTRKLREML